MKWLLFTLMLIGVLCQANLLIAQTSTPKPKSIWQRMSVSGYIKDLNIAAIPHINDSWSLDHLVHNRLNYQWSMSNAFTLQIEARNRLYFGESVKNNPAFGALVAQNLDYLSLGGIAVQKQSFLIHSIIDRANISYTKEKWQVTVGKQRINWGQSYVWNPNDVFNAYSFFDFDYEERRGTDAILLSYETTPLSSWQLATNIHHDWDSTIIATYYRFNQWNFDFQLLAGKYQADWHTGIGWAGQLNTVGFKGELSYFIPHKTGSNLSSTFVGSISFDYRLPSTLNFRLESIYTNHPNENTDVSISQPVSAKTLLNNHWSAFLAIGYDISPLFIIGANGIWNIDDQSWFVNPTITASLNSNTEFLIALQTFAGRSNSLYQGLGSFLYTRLKFNF